MECKDDLEKSVEGEGKVKRKMKTASQLEILENTYAKETYPSETLRAELSGKLGLSDRQLQMWFCHRRLKDRKPTPSKRPQKDSSPAAAGMGSSGGAGTGDEIRPLSEVGNDFPSGSGSGSGPYSHIDLQKRMIVPKAGTDMLEMKRYYEPPQALSEFRAIGFVEAQLGESLREDGPILGLEFDPLPPGAFGTPIAMASGQQKSAGRHYDLKLYERLDAKPIKGIARAVHEYQFLPERPCVRSDAYERPMLSHYHNSPTHLPSTRTPSTTGRLVAQDNEQPPSAYGFHVPFPNTSLLPQQGRQGPLLAPTSTDNDTVPLKNSFPIVGGEANPVSHSIAGFESPFVPSERRVMLEDENLRIERKRKFEEARIGREVEAHEKRMRKELEKQEILMRKREEQTRKEMERQDRERRKEEERLLREKQREEERYQREQRRELERREKFLQKESMRAEKLRLKVEMRKEKEAVRLKLANERATARKIAKESMELIDDERVELMDIAASRKGLPSILSLDSETLESLELLRDLLPEFPPKSVCLKKPFAIQPWTDSEEIVGNLFMVWRFLVTFADVLGIWPFTIDEFVQAFHDYDPRLLGEIHVALLKTIIKDIEDVARTPSFGLSTNQNSAAIPGGGHPQIVEGAYAWGFDIRSWQRHLNPLTWPEILRQFALSAGLGPKLKKRITEQAYRDENEVNDGEDVILKLRNGSAAKSALAIMHERGLSNLRRSRHRLTPGTVKYAAFHVLSLEGSQGLTIFEVADKIQSSGLRDLTTSKTPEASIAAALSRDSKLFERTAPSTYCVRASYRKDPADAEALLSAAREKIQVYKNGILNGEVEDVDKDEADRDEESESDVAEELEAEDLGTELKPSRDFPCEPTNFQSETGNLQDIKPSDHHVKIVGTTSFLSKDLEDATCIGGSDRSVDTAMIHSAATIPYQEGTRTDESQSGEPWVQGLMEGEYSDLSVEERLNALVTLIGLANEGNSIRIVLEDRLEAANVLKKQMWADAQIDKRRIKEDYITKIPYTSFICGKGEQSISAPVAIGRQSPSVVDIKRESSSMHSVVKHEEFGDLHTDPNSISAERCLSVQELPVGMDNIPLQQAAYAAEKSRSCLKAIIGHKAEEMYVYRSLPLGQDRRRNRYWQFMTSSSPNDPGTGRIFLQLRGDRWRLIDSEKDFDALLASLDVRGVRESHLFSVLQMIETSFKEAVRKNSSTISWRKMEESVKTETPEMASDYKSYDRTNSPGRGICASSTDMTESSSSFKIELGNNETERMDALKRYREFEKWMWEECFKSSILCAMKHGKTRNKPIFSVCDLCRSLYTVEDNCCPCQMISSGYSTDSHFSEYNESKEKKHGEARITVLSPIVRIRLLIAQLSSIEVSIPVEALEPVWTDDYRKSWSTKMQTVKSAEELLQILTLLEGGIKRDFLSSDFETTSELLVSFDSTEPNTRGTLNPEAVPVLPWLPLTTSSVALRLMELDSSICYLLSQKQNFQKGRGNSDMMTAPSSSTAMRNISESEVPDASHEAAYLHQEACTKPSRHTTSGQGRGRGRSRGQGHCARSQKRATGSRLEARPKNTANADGLQGWKGGKTRGRGGRKRSQRSVGSRSAKTRQTAVKNITGVSAERGKEKVINIDRNPPSSVQKWNQEEPTYPVNSPQKSNTSDFPSEDNDDNVHVEYDDLMVDNYPAMYSRKSENFRQLKYGGNRDEDYDYRAEEEEEDDDDMDDLVEDEQEDVERYFNGYSDEEGNMDINKKGTGNTDDITESSSEYSD